MSETETKNKKITLIHKLAYGSGNMLGSGALAISGAWLLYFYTTFCNMSVVKATLIFSIATYLDVILNPLMGFITDSFYRTKLGRKFGRRRFFILTGIPLMLLYPMLWVKNMNFFYYLTTYILFEFVYTSIMIPYDTLAVEMTSDFNQRTYLTGFKAMFGKLANFLGAAIPGFFIGMFGKDSPLPFFYTGVTYCVIMIISLTFLYFNSWERPYEDVAEENIPNFVEGIKKLFVDIASTLRIKTFRQHLGMYLFGFGAEWLFTACFTYYIVFCLNQPSTLVSELNSYIHWNCSKERICKAIYRSTFCCNRRNPVLFWNICIPYSSYYSSCIWGNGYIWTWNRRCLLHSLDSIYIYGRC